MADRGFFTPPAVARYALRNVRSPSCLLPPESADAELSEVDLLVTDGRIAGVEPAGTLPAALGPDLAHAMVLPGLVDCHAHIDKAHILPRAPNPNGRLTTAIERAGEDRLGRWDAEDVRRRMDFALRTAYAHGVVAIRTHLDSLGPQPTISFPVFRELRDRWSDRITLQASSVAPLDLFLTDEATALADIVAESGGALGCATRFRSLPNAPLAPEFDVAMRRLFALARERGLDLDLHVDETDDPAVHSLTRVAQLARELDFPGAILCGHCSSLALQDDDRIAGSLDACAAAGIDVVSLPTANLYLQDRREGATPRWRGVTVVHEMQARGLRVAIGGDNCRDPFYPYGDHDMLDTFGQAVKILQLDRPIGGWIRAATATPAAIMGLGEQGQLHVGAPADLVVLRARDYSELLARPQFDRVVVRRGRAIDTTAPDYHELDDLMRMSPRAASRSNDAWTR